MTNLFSIKRRLADRLFSRVIRRRDNYTCVRCRHSYPDKHKGLHASHFYSRRREGTRFDPDNVDTLCLACHYSWSHGDKRTEYIAFKKKQLGTIRYHELYKKALTKPYAEGEYKKYVLENDALVIVKCRAELSQ